MRMRMREKRGRGRKGHLSVFRFMRFPDLIDLI